jgi:uncharacterized protein with HEPN domain
MSERRDVVLFLEDIVESISRIEEYTRDIDLNSLHKNKMVVDAVVRNFSVIGEAVKNIPGSVRIRYPDVEWKEAAGFRDILVHEYFGVDLEAVRDTIRNNLPMFKKHVRKALLQEKRKKIK